MCIKTGVIGGNLVNGSFWDVITDCINLSFDQYLNGLGIDKNDENYDEKVQRANDDYMESGDTLLYGYIRDEKDEYIIDETKDFSCIINSDVNTIQVTRSNYYGNCYHCSPCYPNQGDLATEGYEKAYHLPPELHDSKVKSILIQ